MDYAKDKMNERDILIQTVSDLRAIAQKEFRGGYKNKTITGNNVVETYVSDSRREYCQLVDFLSDFMLPKFDDDMKKAFMEFSDKMEDLVEKQNRHEITEEDFIVTKLRLSRRLLQHLFLLLDRVRWNAKKTTIG